MATKQHYKYIMTLDKPMWPRKIADELSFAPGVFAHLVSVTDLQNDGHIYGATYDLDHGSMQTGGDDHVSHTL
jgi:hypothetical protein